MAEDFEWRTDVESGWEPPSPEPLKPKRQVSPRVKLILLALTLVVLSAIVVSIYTILQGRIEEATTAAESGLLITHGLLVSGALGGDRDLVESLVAERPATWHSLNSDLMSRQLFFSRRPLGIEVVRNASDRPATSDEIHLAPELNEAEVVDRRSYALLAGQRMTETVVLERIFHYKQVDGQWQLSPPTDERAFWGNWVTVEQAHVSVTYPARDERLAVRLSGYLDTLVPKLCTFDGMACPNGFHLKFKLDTDPASVRRLGEGLFPIRASTATAGDRLVLPAPTLVGKPVDEAGYEVLKRGYAGWIGAAIATSYGAAAASPEDVLAHFELQVPPAPAKPLPRPAMATFPIGTSPPSQDVLMLCNNGSSDTLLRFRTGSGTWREEISEDQWRLINADMARPRAYLSRLADYQYAIVQQTTTDEETIWRSFLWRDGELRKLTEEPTAHYILPPRFQLPTQPSNNKLAFLVPGDEDGMQFTALLLDMDRCDKSPCDLQSLLGMPIWSPGGQRTLIIVSDADGNQALYLGDASGNSEEFLGTGKSPAWLDEDRFVFIPLDESNDSDGLGRVFAQQVMLVEIDGQGPSRIGVEPYFDAEMVRESMPSASRPDSLALWTVQPALDGDTWWFVTAKGSLSGQRSDYVLVFSPVLGETRLAAPLRDFRLVEMPMINSTGEKAVITALSDDGAKINVELIDATSGELRRLADVVPQDWSADGDWLIQLDRGVLSLVSTAEDALWRVQHDLAGCHSAVWIERQGDGSDS